MMDKIFNWKAKRAANSITIDGEDAKGNPVKITGIAHIRADRHGPIAELRPDEDVGRAMSDKPTRYRLK